MEKFGHFFEFIAALNSAYIVSNHFTKVLLSTINNDFKKLKSKLQDIKVSQKNSEDYLLQEGAKCPPESTHVLQDLNRENKVILDNITKNEESLDATIEKNAISDNFNFLCLFGALYCLFILLLNGAEFDFHTPYERQSFLLFNAFSVGILLWLFFTKKEKFQPTYKRIINTFFISLLVFPLFFIATLIWPRILCEYNFKWLNVLISVIVPTFHFFYYFYTISKSSKSLTKSYTKEVDDIGKQTKAFATEMSTSINVINKMKVEGDGLGAPPQ